MPLTFHYHRHVHNAATANPLNVDPTRTLMIRRRFIAEMNKAFRNLKRDIVDFMVTQDALGLADRKTFVDSVDRLTANVGKREYEFRTDPQKLTAFNDWFKQQVEANVLSPDPGTPHGTPWTTEFVESAYKRGQLNAYLAGKNLVGTDQSQESFLRSSFIQPETMSKIQLLGTRAFEELKGVTSTMSTEMSRVLAQGLADGRGPMDIAREMTARVDSLTRKRAQVIARTEVINAHAEGQLDAFSKLGIDELGIKAEWSTAGDDRVCEQCRPLEGQTFTIKEARGMIPLHPNCRCSWIPSEAEIKKPTPPPAPGLPTGRSLPADFEGQFKGPLFHGTKPEVIDALVRGETFLPSRYGQGALEWNFGTTEARVANFNEGGMVVIKPQSLQVTKNTQIYRRARETALDEWKVEQKAIREKFGWDSKEMEVLYNNREKWLQEKVSKIVSKEADAYVQGLDTLVATNPEAVAKAEMWFYKQDASGKWQLAGTRNVKAPPIPAPPAPVPPALTLKQEMEKLMTSYEWRKQTTEAAQSFTMRAEINSQQRKAVLDLITKRRPGERYFGKVFKKMPADVDMAKKADKAIEFLRDVVHPDRLASRQIGFNQIKGRAFYSPTSQAMHIDPTDTVGVFVHEYGHHLQKRSGRLFNSEKAFLRKRAKITKLSETKKILGREDEIGFPGDFAAKGGSEYTGRVYNLRRKADGGWDWDIGEVTSMGLQRLYEDPVNFFKQDPDFFTWIVDNIQKKP